jgi:hypothetical protein
VSGGTLTRSTRPCRASLLLFAAALLPLACTRGTTPPVHDGPIVLITLDSLRADVVTGLGGDPGLTPNLERLLGEADWGGRAIASSSWAVPAMASLFTGLRPWQHQALRPGAARLSPALLTLPEALQAAGYETAGYVSGPWYAKGYGYDQGFDLLEPFGSGDRVAERLKGLGVGVGDGVGDGDGDGRRFVWVHIPQPQAPYVRRKRLVSRLPPGEPRLPNRVMPFQLEPYFDPAVPMPPQVRRQFWAMYRLNAAWADERLGRLLEALRESGQWDRTLLVVTANHGEEMKEHGQIRSGGNLGRSLLEVPLAVKLPAGSGLRIEEPEDRRVGAARLWATLVAAVGGEVPPAAAPSLSRQAPPGVLSELYLANGNNRFSLVEGDYQLTWESRFAPADPEYYRARLVGLARGRFDRAGLSRPPKRIFDDLLASFQAAPPLSGRGEPRLTLERWGERGSEPMDDPRRKEEMARRLAAAWSAFLPGEAPPGTEAREWYTGKPP